MKAIQSAGGEQARVAGGGILRLRASMAGARPQDGKEETGEESAAEAPRAEEV